MILRIDNNKTFCEVIIFIKNKKIKKLKIDLIY